MEVYNSVCQTMILNFEMTQTAFTHNQKLTQMIKLRRKYTLHNEINIRNKLYKKIPTERASSISKVPNIYYI